jgi:hypothetical protein
MLATCVAAAGAARAADLPVDAELVLAVDASPSIGIPEFFLQRGGYVAAFRSAHLVDAIKAGRYGRIAVTYVEWAGPDSQRLVIPWTLIDGAESSARLASLLETTSSYMRLGTSISAALAYAYGMFSRNGFDGRRIIDVSGNGPNAVGPPITPIRDAIVASGVTINGLPLSLTPETATLADYYRQCVIGGPGAFIVAVRGPGDFETAIRNKIVWEIAAASAPPLPLVRVSAPGGICDD